MKEYYENKVKMLEKELELARIGFEAKVGVFARKLESTKTPEETDSVLEEIKSYRESVADIESNLTYYKDYYEKEFAIEESKKENAKRILFGGNE